MRGRRLKEDLGERRVIPFHIRLTPKEWLDLRDRAKAKKVCMADYLREIVFGRAEERL